MNYRPQATSSNRGRGMWFRPPAGILSLFCSSSAFWPNSIMNKSCMFPQSNLLISNRNFPATPGLTWTMEWQIRHIECSAAIMSQIDVSMWSQSPRRWLIVMTVTYCNSSAIMLNLSVIFGNKNNKGSCVSTSCEDPPKYWRQLAWNMLSASEQWTRKINILRFFTPMFIILILDMTVFTLALSLSHTPPIGTASQDNTDVDHYNLDGLCGDQFFNLVINRVHWV